MIRAKGGITRNIRVTGIIRATSKMFIEVNTLYSMTFKEVSRELLGNPSAIKPKNLQMRKASNR